MDTNAKPTTQGEKLNGLFVRGVVMSSVAKVLKRKDGTGVFVIVRNEIALQPGLATWEAFHDPKDGKVKLDGESAALGRKGHAVRHQGCRSSAMNAVSGRWRERGQSPRPAAALNLV